MNRLLKAKIVERYGTQADFAIIAEVTESKLSRIIRGRVSIDIADQKRWAKFLGCEVKEIFSMEHAII